MDFKFLNKKIVMIWIKIVATILLLLAIFEYVPLSSIIRSVRQIDLKTFCIAMGLFPLVIFLGSKKWQTMVKNDKGGFTFVDSVISFLGGMSLGLITPGRIGEFGRIGFIENGNVKKLIYIAFIDKMIDLEVTLGLSIIGVAVLFGDKATCITTIFFIVIGIFIFYPSALGKIIQKFKKFFPFLLNFYRKYENIFRVSTLSIFIAALSRICASFIDLLQFYLLINAFEPIDFVNALYVYPILIIINTIPITIMGIGIREGAAIILLKNFGISPESAINASFLLFAINTLIPGVIGAMFLHKIRFKKRKNFIKARTSEQNLLNRTI